MNLAFLKFDYPDLTQEEALFLLAKEDRAQVSYTADGNIADARNPRLARKHIELILLALKAGRDGSTG